ncbi:hypothetical protein FSP39_021861 [Pinctada imbricata]|uniref:B box-type domain-containing protein n=1 Tax=Pinctada imbricata TaxID=66713 RepID=A0AA89BMU1_PINIB|nr:hypothetical protein FSP39_021861 [Pinctada imbricata]
MSDNEASVIPSQTFVECGQCKGNVNISWFCKNCPCSLCDTCATAHKTNHPYKSHTVVPRTYTVLRLYGPAKLAEQCQIHPEKEISSHCNDCGIPCCVTCMVNDHKRHDFSTIEDKYLDAEKGLNKYYRQLDTDIRPTLEKMEEQARADVKEDDSHVEKVINDINDFRKDVVQNFNTACDDLIVQVQSFSSKTNEGLKEIETSLKNLELIKKEIEEKIARGNFDIIKYTPPKMDTLVPKLKCPSKVVPIFQPCRNLLDLMKKPVGIIQSKEMRKDEIKSRNVTSIRSVHVQKCYYFKSKIDVTSMTKAGINMAWVMDCFSPILYLYNNMGKIVRSLTVEGSLGINDMAITKSGETIVTCGDNKVRRVSVGGEVSMLIDTVPFYCNGVCLTDKEEIVVCMRGEGDQNHVAVYSPDGRSKLREIRGRDGQGKHLITSPNRVVQNVQDLCVVNYSENVVCVDERDNVRWLYDGKEARLGNSFGPCCICVDQYKNVLVTDWNNSCVHYIDREGELIQVIMTVEQIGLQYHWGICVDDVTGHVWVGNSSGYVAIAKYLK